MAKQIFSEILIHDGNRHRMDGTPLEGFFDIHGNRPPFLVYAAICRRGYKGTWSLIDGKLWLNFLEGYIAKGELVKIADNAFCHSKKNKIFDDPAMFSEIRLEDIFHGVEGSVFAQWFSGEINASSLNWEKTRIGDKEASVKRALRLDFKDGILISEAIELEFPLTREEIEYSLTNPDISARKEFAESLGDYELTTHQIERGMLDEDRSIRMSFMMYARMKRFAFTSEQIERALTDDNVHIRNYVTGAFREYQFTPFQLERALKDESTRVRANIGMHYCELLTPEQVECGLTDEDGEVRAAFAGGCFDYTPEQIERGLTDENWEVRLWFDTYRMVNCRMR